MAAEAGAASNIAAANCHSIASMITDFSWGRRDLMRTRLVRHGLSMQLRKSQIAAPLIIIIKINSLDRRQILVHATGAVRKLWLGILLEHLDEAAAA